MSGRTTNSNMGGGNFFGVLGVISNRRLVVKGNVDKVCWRGQRAQRVLAFGLHHAGGFPHAPFVVACPEWGWAEDMQPDAGLLLGQVDIYGGWSSFYLEAKPHDGLPLQVGNLCIRTQIVSGVSDCKSLWFHHMLYH